MKIYALVALNPERVVRTYMSLGAARGARTQMRRAELMIVVFEDFKVIP
jgi:hypothetical protein